MKIINNLTIVMILATFCNLFSQKRIVSQIENRKIEVDGNLSEWDKNSWYKIQYYSDGTKFSPTNDLEVNVSFAFDSKNFYIALTTIDDTFEFPNRAWRYGDGFYFTLLTSNYKKKTQNPDTYSSTCFYSYGFSKNQKVLVNKDGKYFPSLSLSNIDCKVKQSNDKINYEIAIPFELLKPFNPFINNLIPLNIIYVDRDARRREIIMLAPDRNFDTEMTDERAGTLFEFSPIIPKKSTENIYHFSLNKNFFKSNEKVKSFYSAILDKNHTDWNITVKLIYENKTKQIEKQIFDFERGINKGEFDFNIDELPTGEYKIMYLVYDLKGKVVYNYNDKIFILNEDKFNEIENKIHQYKDNENLAISLPTLEIRLEWIKEFYKKDTYSDISLLSKWNDEIKYLLKKLKEDKPAVFGESFIKRYAHRSAIDSTLQPYSVFLPKNFKEKKECPLVVVLHGSGVDEQGIIRYYIGKLKKLDVPVLAPKARGLSDWYLGNSGKDVFECINHFCYLFPNIDKDKIFLLGFSMGGYGTWRLGLNNPGYFKGLVILSGALRPPKIYRNKGENILDIIKNAENQNILIIHGAKDNAVPIDLTKEAVKKLEQIKANFEYIELPNAAHGNYDKWNEIIKWIEKYIK